jgi:hypothetical protein
MNDKERNQPNRGTRIARVGAICYFLWGLVHYQASYGVFLLASKLPASMERGRINQDAFYLACFATTGIAVAILLNWRNDRLGFWLNAPATSLSFCSCCCPAIPRFGQVSWGRCCG